MRSHVFYHQCCRSGIAGANGRKSMPSSALDFLGERISAIDSQRLVDAAEVASAENVGRRCSWKVPPFSRRSCAQMIEENSGRSRWKACRGRRQGEEEVDVGTARARSRSPAHASVGDDGRWQCRSLAPGSPA